MTFARPFVYPIAAVLACLVPAITASPTHAAEKAAAGKLLVELPSPSTAPLGKGPVRYVDAARGDDGADGSLERPWKSINYGLTKIQAGETLALRGGTYYENVRVAVRGTAEAPITIRNYPGENPILDGGYAEFAADSQSAWEPVAGGKDEYRSTRTYGNIRYALGSFVDSMIGLHTYYHAIDLRAEGQVWTPLDPAGPKSGKIEMAPVYCGPGLWYDAATGRIHTRLSHTSLKYMMNYEGETDPRRVPLVIAAAHHVPLRLDGAQNVKITGLTIRGGGHDTVILEQTRDIVFDDCTIWAASNGFRGNGAVDLKITRCGFHGNLPPWTFRAENSLRHRTDSDPRDITRLNTHALLVCSAGREFDVYAFPQNDRWEISYCDFTDAHDGVYFGGMNAKFHHNVIRRLHDDGMYLSPMYANYRGSPAKIEIYENLITECLTAVAFGGPELVTSDTIYIYRNRFLLDTVVPTARPSEEGVSPGFTSSGPIGDHGSPPWSRMHIYHNTFRLIRQARSAEHTLSGAYGPDRQRYLFNNIIENVTWPASIPAEITAKETGGKPPRFAAVVVPPSDQGASDGNLYWVAGVDAAQGLAALEKYRKSPAYEESKKTYPAGSTTNSIVADPKRDEVDRLQAGSPAIDAGVPIPADWPDTLRDKDAGKPDIGALPKDAEPLNAGRFAQ
jgi:hypothetical protein